MAVATLPLLRCVWTLAASCANCMRRPCWWTMALKYLHARMAARRVLGLSSVWFLAAVARMSRASSSGDWGCSVLAVLVWGASTNALASASGLSSTMAMSISPPSFLMRAGLPACICSRIALLCLTKVSFPLLLALCASDPVCGGTVRSAGVPRMHSQAMWQLARL